MCNYLLILRFDLANGALYNVVHRILPQQQNNLIFGNGA